MILAWTGQYLTKKSTPMRDPIPPDERLALTLGFLTTRGAQVTIAASYQISPTTTGRIICETCQVIWGVLKTKGYLEIPSNEIEWKKISADFNSYWNFPHALGAIDGKHIIIQAPPKSGSDFFNYKKTHSIVLMGVCDAHYRFTLVDVGDCGRQSDGSVYKNSHLGYAIENNLLKLPCSEKITSSSPSLPYVFLGDDAFGLKTFMMKPYPGSTHDISQRIFNYRLSRGRRTIENTFGILASRFRIFRRPINCHVAQAIQITKATIALHNFLISRKAPTDLHCYCPPDLIDHDSENGLIHGKWRQESCNDMVGIGRISSNNYSGDAKSVRESFKDFFLTDEGAISWQHDAVTRTTLNQDKR